MRNTELIERFLKPEIEVECRRLRIPMEFIHGVYPVFPLTSFDGSFCEPVIKNGKVEQIKIYIDCTIDKPGPALRAFWHEMRHAKDVYEGSKSSELVADLYSLKRYIQRVLHL